MKITIRRKFSFYRNKSLLVGAITYLGGLLFLTGSPCLPVLAEAANIPPGEKDELTAYSYYYQGSLIRMNLSKSLVAIEENKSSLSDVVGRYNLKRDNLSKRKALQKRNLGIYRLPSGKKKGSGKLSPSSIIKSRKSADGYRIQPVFEQGGALMIPADEIIVGFKPPTTLDWAEQYLAPFRNIQGIIGIREHGENTYILKIDNPSDGRCYQVSQFLSRLNEVVFAEPNDIVIMLYGPDNSLEIKSAEFKKPLHSQGQALKAGPPAQPIKIEGGSKKSPVSWAVLVDENFEGGALPSGWSTPWLGFADAYWSPTNYRAYSGSGSFYASGAGTAGVPPPGPYPNNCFNCLLTPVLNLANYEEVYIEFWFYAKYENFNPGEPGAPFDQGWVALYDYSTPLSDPLDYASVMYTGDLTADPTTDNGWRRMLVRVPPSLRLNGLSVAFIFSSDDLYGAEGLYIDDVRVVGTTDVDTEPLGNDTYGARGYELRNSGQIAGLGDDGNDLHVPEAWDLVTVSSDIVVAVIDCGVELNHPDLNLVTGYNHDGSVGGGPPDNQANHGTACAGNVGAIRNNSIGVIGTAPSVKIMPIYNGSNKAEMADAVNVAVNHGADILSNSWGWVGSPSQDITNAINAALSANRVVVMAAGNGPDRSPWNYEVAFPAYLTGSTNLICVGAGSPTDEHKATASSDGIHSWGSSYVGDGPDICAPGPWSYTVDRQGSIGYNPTILGNNSYSMIDPSDSSSENYDPTFGGTSSSVPKVSGIVALMLSANPNLTPAQVKSILKSTADPMTGGVDKIGAGRVNAYEAVLASSNPSPTPTIPPAPNWIYDYNGDGTSDIAIFRESSGLWSVRGITRIYFGGTSDAPVPGDYNGDGTTEVGIFRGNSGLWAIRAITRLYFGSSTDEAIPGDYDGNGCCDTGIFRDASGLWAIRGMTRVYFGSSTDEPVPGYYNADGSKDIGLFRPSSGLWAIRGLTRIYFGGSTDEPVPGDYNGDGSWDEGIFRPSSGLWAIRGITRRYFGGTIDLPVPADYAGTGSDSIGIFRSSSGLWAVSGITRLYYGSSGDIPVVR